MKKGLGDRSLSVSQFTEDGPLFGVFDLDKEAVGSVKELLAKLFEALRVTVPEESNVSPTIAPCQNPNFGDYQCNNAIGLRSKLKGKNTTFKGLQPIGKAIMEKLPASEIIDSCSTAEPGFINVKISREWIAKSILSMLVNGIETWAPRLSVKRAEDDFSSPNIAKEMHVGHLRSTIIGDTLARMLEFSNVEVLRRNHVGDWGTQVVFGTFTHSAEDDTMSDVSSTSYMSISSLDAMDTECRKLILWNDLGYSVAEVIQQGDSDCCVPATLSECLPVGVRSLCGNKEIPRVSIPYLMDSIPRPFDPDAEKCRFEDAYSFLMNTGAVFDYSFQFTNGRRNKPPGVARGKRVKIDGAFVLHNPTIDELRLKELLETLENKHPVIGGIELTFTFQRWNGEGVYYPSQDYVRDPCNARQLHAILIVDYALKDNMKDNRNTIWFKVKNSGGIGWGDRGHAWIDGSSLIHISYPKNPTIVDH